MENGIDFSIIEKIIGFVVVLAGIVGGLITTISVAKKSLMEASANRDTVKIAKQKADTEIEIAKEKADVEIDLAKIEMTEKVENMYKRLCGELEGKFDTMQKEIDVLKEQIRLAHNEKKMYREAGIKLIHAIEAGIRLRPKINGDLEISKEYTIADQELLVTLKEVKILFETGDK